MNVITEKTKGIIESSFGKSGKIKVYLQDGTTDDCKVGEDVKLIFKRYIHDSSKKMIQNYVYFGIKKIRFSDLFH